MSEIRTPWKGERKSRHPFLYRLFSVFRGYAGYGIFDRKDREAVKKRVSHPRGSRIYW